MTVSSLVPVNNYSGNSYSTKFDFDFLIEKESELKVYLINSSGYSILLENGIDYSINEIGNPNGSYITFPLNSSKYEVLNSDEKLSLALDLVIKQENEFKNSLYFNFSVLEWTFDYIIRILQIFSRRFERAVLVTEGADVTPSELLNNIEKSESASKAYSEISKSYSLSAEGYSGIAKGHSEVAQQEAEKAEEQAEIAVQKAREIGTVTFLPVSFLYGNACAEEFPSYAEWICDGRDLNSEDYSEFVEKYLDSGVFSVCRYKDYNAEISQNGYCKKFAVNPFIYNRSQFTVVGSPEISDDGIASGFDNSNYIKISTNRDVSLCDYEIDIPFSTTGNSIIISTTIANSGNMSLAVIKYSGKLMYFLGNGSKWSISSNVQGTANVADNTDYVVKLIRTTSNYTFKLLNVATGIEVTDKVIENTSNLGSLDNLYLGTKSFWSEFTGSTIYNLNEFKVIVFDNSVNTFKLPLYRHTDEFHQKTDLDLGNLSEAGKKVIDGQWINSSMQLSSAIAKGNYTIDLSEYLPNDNYNYEILITCEAYKGDVGGSFAAYVSSDLIEHSVCVARNSTYSRGSACSVVLPVNQTRKIYYNIANTVSDMTVVFYAVGYRRIGTNS